MSIAETHFWAHARIFDYCSKKNSATVEVGRVMSIPYLISALRRPPWLTIWSKTQNTNKNYFWSKTPNTNKKLFLTS
jgi:hypothetical protein